MSDDGESSASFSYSRPQSRQHVHNVSFSPLVSHPSESSTINASNRHGERQQQPPTSAPPYARAGGGGGRSSSYSGRYLRMPAQPRHQVSYTLLAKQDLKTANVFGIIHRIRRDIKKCIETALTYEQLNSPKLVFGVVRPLQDAYLKLDSPCTIYALLLNRVYFDSQQYTLSSLSVNNTRAMLCEILAVKVLRALYEEDTSENGVFRLAILLASTFSPFQGAPDWAIPDNINAAHGAQENDRKISTSALELAIVSEAKRFIRAVPTQKVIMDIWRGKIVYSSLSFRYLIKDQYKRRPIMKYNARNAPLLDHYRLRVPRIRAALEWLHFFVLFVSYLVVLRTMQKHTMNGYEIFWVIYAFGFALDKFASLLELGWTVFNSNLWNGLDFIFISMFIVYLPLRIIGLRADQETAAIEALSILTCAGCILFPRFAFTTLSDNLLILSLRSMLAQFTKLMVLAVWCFAGFFVAFVTLGGGKFKSMEIIQWMIWIWFGLDSTGLKEANKLHNVLGPILMVIYSCLSSTLLLTVLVSILSNTFNQINRDAIAEQMYRRAVSTFQGVKSDGIFSFQPPINILALIFLWPARIFVTPHTYHKIIVFAARFTNLPLLLIIRLVERHFLFRGQVYGSGSDGSDGSDSGKPKWWRPSIWAWKLDWFGGTRTELNAVFEYESDIDDDALPGGAFDIHDGVMTPANVESDTGDITAAAKIMQLGGGISSSASSNANGGGGGRANSRGRESMRRKSSKQHQQQHQQLAYQQEGGREMDIQALRERSRQRRTQSMSDWGGTIASTSSNTRVRPTILSKLYGYGSSRMNVHQYNPIPNTSSGSTGGGAGSIAAGNRKMELNDEDTIRTPNTAGSRISWPLSGTGSSSSRFAVAGPGGFNEEEQEEEEEDNDEGNEEEEEERRNIRDRLDRIEEGQKRIEEALKALGGGGD